MFFSKTQMRNGRYLLMAVAVFAVLAVLTAEYASAGSEETATVSDDSGICGVGVSYTFDSATGTLTVTGTGNMFDFNTDNPPWANYRDKIKTISLENAGSVGEFAFEKCTALTALTISDSVTSVGRYAFSGCTSLTALTVPGSVKSIDDSAFLDCNTLGNLTLTDGIASIETYAFSRCISLETLTVPGSVKSIGYDCFSECTSLKTVTLNEGLETLGNGVFEKCTALTSATVPKSVSSVPYQAFYGCTALTSVTVSSPIGNQAFEDCTALNNVTLSEGVTSIGDYAFSNCAALTAVNFPASLTSLGGDVFYQCRSIMTYSVESGSKTYCATSDGVLLNKDKSELVLYPAGKVDGEYNVPAGVVVVGSNAFRGCTHLTVLSLGKDVIWFDAGAIAGCSSLTEFRVNNENTSFAVIDGVLFDKEKTDLCLYPSGKAGAYTVPDGVTMIDGYAFAYSQKLTSITFSDSVKTIDEYAFASQSDAYPEYGCAALEEISFGKGLEWVDSLSFYKMDFTAEGKMFDLNFDDPNGKTFVKEDGNFVYRASNSASDDDSDSTALIIGAAAILIIIMIAALLLMRRTGAKD